MQGMIKRFFIAIIFANTILLLAQKNNASPYSYYGIGIDFSTKTVEQSSMGGIGIAMTEFNYLNFVNPAGAANLRVATYGIGGLTSFVNLKNDQSSQNGNFTSLQYIALGFPIGNKAGFSAGLKPASSVGYTLLNQEYGTNNQVLELTRFKGDGGTNKFFGSFGIFLYKDLSIGIEGSYVFGNIKNSILNQKEEVILATKYQSETNIKGLEVKIGAQYKTKINSSLNLSGGIAIKLPTKLTQKGSEAIYNLAINSSGIEKAIDTLSYSNIHSNFTEPIRTNIGVGIGKQNKWYVGLNTELRNAQKNTDQGKFKYENGFRTSLGGYYIPKTNSISSYWNRITYRAGFRYEKTGLSINNNGNFTSVNDFGINLGLGLPLPKQISNLNFGFEYGQRGTTDNNLIKESYYNLRLSLSLNSLNWFKKRKID